MHKRTLLIPLLLGWGLHLTCHPKPAPAPASPTADSVRVSAQRPTLPGAATTPPAPRPPSSAAPTGPLHTPDPGPGWIGCGADRCEAGKQVCRLDVDTETQARKHRCIRKSALELDPQAIPSCDPSFDYKACDGPGDCAPDETCCYEAAVLIGPCFEDPDSFLERYTCQPLNAGRIACHNAEVCSENDPACVRPGASCVADKDLGLATCFVPPRRKPRCGDETCPDEMFCAQHQDGTRECVPPGGEMREDAALVECDRGSDCPPDQACFANGWSHRCDFNAISWVGNDVALCEDDTDCGGFCRDSSAKGVCHDYMGRSCECRPPCRHDADCKKDDAYCVRIAIQQQGGSAYPRWNPFCDQKKSICDCSPPP